VTIDENSGWVPESCSLPTVEQPLRVAEFDRLFAESVLGSRRITSTRLELVVAPDAEATARDLAAREAECCSFFNFDFVPMGSDVAMRIDVPASRTDVLDALDARVRAIAASESR
jgi:hypothetical protein